MIIYELFMLFMKWLFIQILIPYVMVLENTSEFPTGM